MSYPAEKLINGEMLTKELLIERHGKLVYSVSKRFKGLEDDDIISIGNMGLLKAFYKFDYEKFPVRFSTYAIPMITGEIRRFIRDTHAHGIMFSRATKELGWLIIKESLEDESVNAIAKKLDKPINKVIRSLTYLDQRTSQSLDKPLFEGEGEDSNKLDRACGIEDDITYLFVQEFVSTLNDKQKFVLAKLLEGCSQQEIAEASNSYQVQVSRIVKQIRAKYLLRGVN